MIMYMIFEMINTITEEFRDMKSNIVNIQEKDNDSDYKRRFWGNVLMILISTWLIILTVVLVFMVVYPLVVLAGLKTLLPIIVVAVLVYAMFKTEVFYKMLYKLFKKDSKENDK